MFVDVGSTFWQQKMKLWLSFFPQNLELKIAKSSCENSMISLGDINRHQNRWQNVGVARCWFNGKVFSIFGTDRDTNHKLSLKMCLCIKFCRKKCWICLSPQQLKMSKAFFGGKLSNKSELKKFVTINFLSSAFLHSVC